jgi:uncharacterized protein YprB with RNaseH-like and TPR domain
LLRRTFCHVPGIGQAAERALWAQGCDSWDTYLDGPGRFAIGTADRQVACEVIEASRRALEERRHQYFVHALGHRESWRAWEAFRDSCVYLDIETDGRLSGSSVTTIGLYDGAEFRCLVQGQDLDSFRDIISRYAMVVTFFGSQFDIPLLQKRFRGGWFDQIHLDLCIALRRLGYRGGLKRIERQLGIERSDETGGMSGRDAIAMWEAYRRGNGEALDRLIAYNREDVVNLEVLAGIAFRGLSAAALGG